jgi:glycosyltransferase involved in cell wall biosynthesis
MAGLQQQAREQGLAGQVTVRTGWVEHQQVPAYLGAADVLVSPYRDNLINRAKCSAKILAYMAMGKAIVTSAVGQNLVYLVDGRSGLLTKPGDVGDLSQGLIRLLSDRTLAREMGANARLRAHRLYRWEDWVRIVERSYASVARQSR